MMYVKHLHVKNMRGLKDVQLSFKPGVNLLVGPNSVGKSTVLDALRIMLSALTSRVQGNYKTTKRFVKTDIRNGSSKATLSSKINLHFHDEDVSWFVRVFPEKDKTVLEQDVLLETSDFSALQRFNLDQSEDERTFVRNLLGQSFPLVAYYNVHRALKGNSNSKLKSIGKINLEPSLALENALDATGVDFARFEAWFAHRYNYLKRSRKKINPTESDIQLRAVRDAIVQFLPDISAIRFSEAEEALLVKKAGHEYKVTQLSDGELCLLALVADIARRLAIANPAVLNPLEESAVVLVDEIELHLHPAWQRKVVGQFEKTFPNVQFIFTTHSPQILSHVKPDSIWLFQRNEEGQVEPYQPSTSFGMDSSSILKLLFDVSEREESTEQQLRQLVQLVDQNQLEAGKKLIAELQTQCGDIDLLQRMKAVIWRKELLAGRDVKDQ